MSIFGYFQTAQSVCDVAALAYFFDHQEQISGDLAKDEQMVEEFMRQHPDRVQKN